ncbi:hypothetical protein TWF694_002674 [Orbilia ellipsospora]|uniref:5'-3' DNA helicase ZGRF1-like N-terminal domain-containing protein n=1 Tax=Orbilia ellipsospora TaxID=2528407 RepID=A0AAV9X595_9PEZI
MSFSSIPLSSQSAPIDEYIVLWTADKYKKLKKWHDGYLRYHTFNKRLMVYDHMMNKVCDKFLPEPEPIDVGDELVFDTHLITIEAIKGRQAQDLRPLFEKTVDRRNERSATATPIRSNPVYPSSVSRPVTADTPAPVVPQKRPSTVRKIPYKPFNVPKVRTDGPTTASTASNIADTPSKPPTKRNKPSPKDATNITEDIQIPAGLHLANDVFGADEDTEILELDLEESDFAKRPEPQPRKRPIVPPRARPNAPPPFTPPISKKLGPKRIQQSAPIPTKQATPEPISSPEHGTEVVGNRVPPENLTLINSSSGPRSSPTKTPVIPGNSSQFNIPSQIKSPSPDPSSEPSIISNDTPTHRLTLPSAKSRTKRKLLCGPSIQRGSTSGTLKLIRPVYALSTINMCPQGDAILSKASSPSVKPIRRNERKRRSGTHEHESEQAEAMKSPKCKTEPVDDILDLDISDFQPSISKLKMEEQSPEPVFGKPNRQIKKSKDLQIFSSDDEFSDLAAEIIKHKPGNSKQKVKSKNRPQPPDSDSDLALSLDEFETLRSSAVSKSLLEESRNKKRLRQQKVSEKSRVWKENDN